MAKVRLYSLRAGVSYLQYCTYSTYIIVPFLVNRKVGLKLAV